jgi:uncharacterized OB-fold protein
MHNIDPIIGKKCKKCGFLQHPSHLRCLQCKNNTFDVVEAKGNCKLITYTVLYAVPSEYKDKQSYALGIVEFENGIKTLGQIYPKDNLKIGMKLKPVYEKLCDNFNGKEIYSYVFRAI